MIARTFLAVLLSVGLVTALAVGRPADVRGGSPTWNYPADCLTVQACINAASPGDTVFMFADATSENISISKSVSLKSGNATKYKVNFVSYGDVSTPVISTLAGIEITLHLSIFLNSTTGSSVIVRNITVGGQAGQAASIGVDVETSASVTIENSVARSVGNAGHALGMLAAPNGGQVNFRVAGNRFDGNGNAASGDGISLTTLSTGNLTADIYNNSIWDVARSSNAGIFISASGTVHADVNVVGNTVEKAGLDGLQERNMLTGSGLLALDLFNNTFSHAKAFGVRLDAGSPGTMTLRAGFNNFFANTSGNARDGLSLGSKNLAADPRFVDRVAGNLALTSSSPLINKGKTCSPGGVTNPDAALHHRLFDKSVDIGAYERGASAATGIVLLGTEGADSQQGSLGSDILCGYGGGDTQDADEGDDYLDGGAGADVMRGEEGADRMLGGSGNDNLCADDGTGTDFLNGGSGNDGFLADSGDTKKSVEHSGSCAG